MSVRVVSFLMVFLGVAFVALLTGETVAGEPASVSRDGAPAGDGASVSCTRWFNCDAESPNYTGYCCRCCRNTKGVKQWECKGTPTGGALGEVPLAGTIPAGEAIISGIVTRECILKSDDGLAYAVAGEKAEELHRNMGRKIEVKGTVQEAEGKVTIDVETYALMPAGSVAVGEGSQTESGSGSCKAWRNCSALPPTFTGTCCRECEDAEGRVRWNCRVFSFDEYFNLAEWLE